MKYFKRSSLAAASLVALTAAVAGATDTGTISGLVTDQDGQPVNGALVWVKRMCVYTETNADGYYSIQNVPPGTFYVKAFSVGCGERAVGRVNVDAGLRTTLSFQLRSGAPGEEEEIESQVVDKFADKLVRTPGIVHENSDASTLDEDVRGGEVPPAGKARANDTGTISGLVTDQDGQPVDGALVVVTGADLSATTDADGYYVITPVPPGTFYVKALRVGCGEQVRTGVKVVAGLKTNLSFQLRLGAAGEEEEIESQVVDEFADILVRPSGIVLENSDASTLDEDVRGGEVPPAGKARANDTGTISGFVTDEDGRPLSGALVAVKGANRYAASNADGYYSIRKVPVGTFDMKASRVGCGEQVRTGVKVVAGLRTSTSFQLESKTTGTTDIQSEEPLTKWAETYTESIIGSDQIKTQVVDEFADVFVRTPGIYLMAARPAWTLDRHIRSGGVADAGWVSGFVTDEDGRPLSGASVVVTGADLSATTDADGYYHIFDVPVGTFDVTASRVGCGEQVESGVKVVAGLRTNLSFQLRLGVTGELYVPSEEPVYSEE